MRFRRWPKPAAYGDTSRKRAAFLRKQRLEREALPLFADQIASTQHGVDEEMARRALWWNDAERRHRDQRAASWRKACARLFALPDGLRRQVRDLWRTCPYPADPASFADFLHQIAVGRLDPNRPPWVFHQAISARTTPNPATFDEAFRQIGCRKVGGGPKTTPADELLFCGNLGGGIIFLAHLIHDRAGIRWRVSRKVLITLRDWVSRPSFSRDRAEPHPPCPRIGLSHSVFQPSAVRKWSPPLTVAA